MGIKDIYDARKKTIKHMSEEIYGTRLQGFINRLKKPSRIIELIAGAVLMITAASAFSPPDTLWFFSGMAVCTYAATSGYLGFLNAIICSFTVFAAFPFADVLQQLLIGSFTQTSKDFILSYIPLFATMPIILIISLIIRSKLLKKPVFSIIRETDNIIRISDPLFERFYPVHGFSTFIQIGFTSPAIKNARSLISDFIRFANFCDKQKAIPVGAKFLKQPDGNTDTELYVYTDDENKLEDIKKYFSTNNESFLLTKTEDSTWQKYIETVLPDDITVQYEYNRHFTERMERKGFDLSQTKRLSYIVSFNTETEAQLCIENASENGLTPIETNGQLIKKDTTSLKNAYIVTLTLESKLGIERLNINSRNVIDYVKKFNGHLRHWILSHT